jgi:hypothetical protein
MQALVQICAARTLPLTRPLSALVRVEMLGDAKETKVKKNCSDRPCWNQTLSFAIPPHASRELVFRVLNHAQKPPAVVGSAKMVISSSSLEFIDVWLPLVDALGIKTSMSLHVCVQSQVLPVKSASLKSPVPPDHNSNAAAAPPVSAAQGRQALPRQTSDFEGTVEAVSINELVESLERVKRILDSAPEVSALHLAKRELLQAREQIGDLAGLQEEWKTKFLALVEDEERICLDMITQETWKDVAKRAQNPPPPPLPSKATLARVRSARSRKDEPPPPAVKSHYIASLEAFDAFMLHGFVSQVVGGVDAAGTLKSRRGDLVRAWCVGFIYDGTTMLAVQYTSFSLESILGSPPDFLPRGLDQALLGLWAGCQASVTISPALAFGDAGSDEVPPNSNLVFDVTVQSLEPPPTPMVAELELFDGVEPDSVSASRQRASANPRP